MVSSNTIARCDPSAKLRAQLSGYVRPVAWDVKVLSEGDDEKQLGIAEAVISEWYGLIAFLHS